MQIAEINCCPAVGWQIKMEKNQKIDISVAQIRLALARANKLKFE